MDDAENALLSLEALPRLPTPEYAQRRKEAIGGTVLIYAIIILQTAVTLTCAFATPSMPEGVTHALAAVILSAAATAAISHAFVLFADPGIVKRSVRTCHPIPEEVANRIRSGVEDDFGPNVHNDGKSFCTRCLVWRPERSHHCRICQRCVRGFDHHCGVLGRCITQRNMPAFVLLLWMAAIGGATTMGAAVRALRAKLLARSDAP